MFNDVHNGININLGLTLAGSINITVAIYKTICGTHYITQ